MIKSLFAAAALAGLALSTAATAADAKDRAVASSPAADATAPAAAASAKVESKYCVVDNLTGSRIPKKTCKTRSEWQKEGFDPLNP